MNRTILITGSSTGIGRETARYFQKKGWNVIATMRTPDKEEELRALDNVVVTRLDVLDSSSIQSSVETAIKTFDRIDVLLNNAGYGTYGILEATSMEKVRRQMDVNLIGLIETTKAVIPHFRKNKSGMIINVTSLGGRVAHPIAPLYHASKFAVEGFTESLFYEMEAIGVSVKLIEPGRIETDFATRSIDINVDEELTEYQEFLGKVTSAIRSRGTRTEPIIAAEVIYRAATDGTDQLRYPVGDDAVKGIAERLATTDDMAFIAAEKARNGL